MNSREWRESTDYLYPFQTENSPNPSFFPGKTQDFTPNPLSHRTLEPFHTEPGHFLGLMYPHIYIHIYTHTDTLTNTYIHTFIHTHIYSPVFNRIAQAAALLGHAPLQPRPAQQRPSPGLACSVTPVVNKKPGCTVHTDGDPGLTQQKAQVVTWVEVPGI